MNVLVTAGNTQSPIDRVRCITNIFTGRTGASVARMAWKRGHAVTLLTSHPETLREFGIPADRFTFHAYRTFDELAAQLEERMRSTRFDAVCHSAAVSDYLPSGSYSLSPGTSFNACTSEWLASTGAPALTEQIAGKIESSEPELWLRLVRAPKLIDRFRQPWGFIGVLVKFKLEVGLSEEELLVRAETSRTQSAADLMVANTLEGAKDWAYLGPRGGRYERIARPELPERLWLAVERANEERTAHG